MTEPADELLASLAELRTELTDFAYFFDRRGRADAADVVTAIARRLGDLCDRFEGKAPADSSHAPEYDISAA